MADNEQVRQVFQEMIKPYKALIMLAVPVVLTLASYGYDVVMFVNRDAAHESRQDADIRGLRAQVLESRASYARLQSRHLDLLQLTISDLDLIGSLTLRCLPKRGRDSARKEFDAQRRAALSLLVEARKGP